MPGPPIDLMTEVGVERGGAYVQMRRENASSNVMGCWIFGGSTNTDGYGQIYVKKNSNLRLTGRAAQTAVLLHKLSWVAANGRNCPVGQQISHRCDIRACFNPDHLWAELPVVNNSRKGCPGEIICSVHHHPIVNLCPHSPLCIRPERDDVLCCLTLKESSPRWATQMEEGSSQDLPLPSLLRSGPLADVIARSSSEYAGRSSFEELVAQGLL